MFDNYKVNYKANLKLEKTTIGDGKVTKKTPQCDVFNAHKKVNTIPITKRIAGTDMADFLIYSFFTPTKIKIEVISAITNNITK